MVDTPRWAAPAPVSGSVGSILSLQRQAGNQATLAMLSHVQRRVDKSTDPKVGPSADIPNSSLSKDDKPIVDKAVKAIKSGEGCPWPRLRKWGVPHANREGRLPGKKGAGGYDEYYLPKYISTNSPEADLARLVVGGGRVFHTADHYRTFTHYGQL